MKDNILGGLVIFMVVVTCLLMLDDMTSVKQNEIVSEAVDVNQVDQSKELAIVDSEE
ncbi:hypothetical protein [Winogradskyella vidalii]|uniref:hypothetical protein n=1 Tax=Winogradskyella vidalii TaxID=2615024 RepID=UPI0015CA38E4|nr:hypothetical protein [Winogradskyella vidalii]